MGTKISELAAASALTGTETVPVVQGGITERTTAQAIANLAPAGASVDIGYAQVTADQNTITTIVDLTGLTKTVTVVSGHRIKITGYAEFTASVANNRADLLVYESTTALNRGTTTIVNTGYTCSAEVVVVLTPSAGGHTYKLRAELGGGTGNVSMKAGTTIPAFILIEDLGVASA